MTCPHCRWNEYTPVRRVVQEREGVLARLLSAIIGRPLTRKTGDVVCCAKCVTQYVASVKGAYKIDGTEEEARPMPDDKTKPPLVIMRDRDQEWG